MDTNDNLIPFKPGQSGNPAGKKPGTRNVSTDLKKLLKSRFTIQDQNGREIRVSGSRVIAIGLFKQASKGNVKAAQAIMDRTEGKVVQPMELAGPGGVPLAPPQIIVEGVDGADGPDE